MNPKIIDFELSMVLKNDDEIAEDRVVGTLYDIIPRKYFPWPKYIS